MSITRTGLAQCEPGRLQGVRASIMSITWSANWAIGRRLGQHHEHHQDRHSANLGVASIISITKTGTVHSANLGICKASGPAS